MVLESNGWDTSFGARITLIRTGPQVMFTVENLARGSNGSGWVTVLVLPSGFIPVADVYSTDYRLGRVRVLANGSVQINAPTTQVNYFYFTFQSTNTFPSSLPGTPR